MRVAAEIAKNGFSSGLRPTVAANRRSAPLRRDPARAQPGGSRPPHVFAVQRRSLPDHTPVAEYRTGACGDRCDSVRAERGLRRRARLGCHCPAPDTAASGPAPPATGQGCTQRLVRGIGIASRIPQRGGGVGRRRWARGNGRRWKPPCWAPKPCSVPRGAGTLASPGVEARVACSVLKRMTPLGRPIAQRVQERSGSKLPVCPSLD
jgi:hypothetical protein